MTLSSFENLKNKKLVPEIAGGIAVILIIILGIFITTPRQNNTAAPQQSGISPQNSLPQTQQNTTRPSTTPGQNANWQTYSSPYFTLQYPPGWTATGGTITNGASFDFVPANKATDNLHWQIQIYNLNTTSLQQVLGVFEAFGYPKSSVNAGGVIATEYKGSLPLTPSNNLYEQTVIFQYNGSVYQIKTGYQAQKPNQLYDQDFARMVAFFQLPK